MGEYTLFAGSQDTGTAATVFSTPKAEISENDRNRRNSRSTLAITPAGLS